MDKFGYPPKFPELGEIDEIGTDTTQRVKKVKSKVAAKDGSSIYQWDIMKGLGLTDEEIKQFSDPHHWLLHFPPLAKSDLTSLGCRV